LVRAPSAPQSPGSGEVIVYEPNEVDGMRAEAEEVVLAGDDCATAR
jgi:hypothetical protein